MEATACSADESRDMNASDTSAGPLSRWPLLLLGIATGALSGLLGIGGGIVMVPALVAMGETRHRANANSLATIFLVALAGAIGFAVSDAFGLPVF